MFKIVVPLLLIVAYVFADTYAVVFTSSEGVYNGAYRHQADAYRFVQLLQNGGVPRNHIFHMNPDTMRFNQENPTYGYLFTKPGCDARDVTHGVTVDYPSADINVTTFKRMLSFRDIFTHQILDLPLNPNDTIIYYFVGHGGLGTLSCKDEYIYYDDIIEGMEKVLYYHNYLHIYMFVDSCKAGSLFDHETFSQYVYLKKFNATFSHDINVITATNSTHNSYATYCDCPDVLKIFDVSNFCLTDEFSSNLMDYVYNNTGVETINDMFNTVQNMTAQSPVSSYGAWDNTTRSRTIRDVFGIGDIADNTDYVSPIYMMCNTRRLRGIPDDKKEEAEKSKKRFSILRKYIKEHPEIMKDADREELADLKNYELRAKALSGEEKEKFTKLYNEEKKRIADIDAWEASFKKSHQNMDFDVHEVKNWNCYRKIIQKFEKRYGHTLYGMNRFNYLAALCNKDENAYENF